MSRSDGRRRSPRRPPARCRRRSRRCSASSSSATAPSPRLLLASLAMTAAAGAARRAGRAVAEAAHRRRDRPRPHQAAASAPLGLAASATADLVPQRVLDRADRPAPRPAHHRPPGPRRPPAGRRSRRSSTTSGPSYLDRLSVLRNQVFALDHLFSSLFSTVGWLVRLAFVVRPAGLDPARCCSCSLAVRRPDRARRRRGGPRSSGAPRSASPPHDRLARHLFTVGHHGAARQGGAGRRHPGRTSSSDGATAWEHWYAPIAPRAGQRRRGTTLRLGGVRRRLRRRHRAGSPPGSTRSPGDVVLVLVAGRPALGLRRRRRSASSASCAASGSTPPSGWPGWRTTPPRRRRTPTCPRPTALDDGIRFEDVSFAYPGTDRLVLERRRPHAARRAAVVAIVGENGAGKTTLVKLLAGMYAADGRADHGRRRRPGAHRRRRVAGAARRRVPGLLPLRAPARRPRVGLGDEPRSTTAPRSSAAVGRAGADDVVDDLRAGLDTQLGPTWDGGVDVSFGQWQKLALARGFMRDEPLLLVLDEPTAALDAETEHALFERYAGRPRREPTTTAGSRSSCRTASRPCGWPT